MPSPLRTTLTAIWAALHTTQYGLAITGLNGIQDAVTCSIPTNREPTKSGWLRPCIAMSVSIDPRRESMRAGADEKPTQFGLVVSIFTLGGLIGSLGSNAITKRLGRINTLRASAGCIMLGSTIVGLANHLSLMIIGRVLIGLGCGLATVTVPLFLAEIAPPSIKKSLGILNQLFIVFGMLTGQSLSFPFSHGDRWRYVFLVAVVIGVVQLLASFFIKDGERAKAGEDEPLLGQEEVEPLSIKGLLTTNDPKIRRACKLEGMSWADEQSLWSSLPRYLSRRAAFPQSCTFRPGSSSQCSTATRG